MSNELAPPMNEGAELASKYGRLGALLILLVGALALTLGLYLGGDSGGAVERGNLMIALALGMYLLPGLFLIAAGSEVKRERRGWTVAFLVVAAVESLLLLGALVFQLFTDGVPQAPAAMVGLAIGIGAIALFSLAGVNACRSLKHLARWGASRSSVAYAAGRAPSPVPTPTMPPAPPSSPASVKPPPPFRR